MADLFNIELDNSASMLDLYAEAQEEASRVGIVAQLEQNRTMEANKELLRRATTDGLTGISNRARFDERLAEAIDAVGKDGPDFAIVMFDVDHFKKFNDTYGHEAGDAVLKRVALAAQGTLRQTDMLARYGGEEFVVLSPGADRKSACVLTARIARAVERLSVDYGGEQLRVTVSAGFALSSDYDVPPAPEQIVGDADKQLYLSKRAGRNTWSYLGRTASLMRPQKAQAAA
jgi:diguanylate cyclase (GGDEF)-like protein